MRLAEAELAAQNLRTHWDLGIDPIPNLVELLEERGIKVLVVDSKENIDGLAAQVARSAGANPRDRDPPRHPWRAATLQSGP